MSYSVYVTRDEDSGTASISYDNVGGSIEARCKNYVYNADNNIMGYSEMASGMGFTYAQAVANNRFQYDGYYFYGTVMQANGSMYINGSVVQENIRAT